jgi:CheY-like chemotaxis protein
MWRFSSKVGRGWLSRERRSSSVPDTSGSPLVKLLSPLTYQALVLERHAASPLVREAAVHALIIEDESLIGLAIEDALRGCGCSSFDLACSFEEAVEAATKHCPDLITADVQLAPGSGVEAVATICGHKQIPVIFITGTPAEVQKRFPSYPIVHKPFATAEIAAAVRAVMSPLPRAA